MSHREIEREIVKDKPRPLTKEGIKPLTIDKSEFKVLISHHLEKKMERAFQCSQSPSMEGLLEEMVDLYLKFKDKVAKAERITKKEVTAKPITSAQRRNKRSIPLPIKHEVHKRDRGQCQFKDCKETKWTEIHHVLPFSKGGTHSLGNLITLCSGHHSLMHVQNKTVNEKGTLLVMDY